MDLISLHEELLQFILKYRAKKQLGQGAPNFLLRAADDVEALQEGRWFYDDKESGWIFIHITNSNSLTHNLYVGVNIDGSWGVGDILPKENAKPQELGDILHFYLYDFEPSEYTLSLDYLKDSPVSFFKIKDSYIFRLEEVLDLLFKFYRTEVVKASHLSFQLPTEAAFVDTIKHIEVYRQQRRQPQKLSLSGFSIKDYQGIKEVDLCDLPATAPWIFLTGENGFGKTSLLRALALGLHGESQQLGDVFFPRNSGLQIDVVYEKNYDQARLQIRNVLMQQGLFFQPIRAIATYGPTRLDKNQDVAGEKSAIYNLFYSDHDYLDIEADMRLSFHDNNPKYKAICKMLQTLIPTLERIEYDKKSRILKYYEKAAEEETTFEAVSYSQLASGIKSIIAMAGDIYLRLADAQENLDDRILIQRDELQEPELPYGNYKPEELVGIVIIDELDLHLHPKWQRSLPALLSKVFPKVQFIASTHSPIPLLGAPEGSIFLKVNRTVKEGVIVERLEKLEKEIHQLLPNTILSSPIFDFDFLHYYSEEQIEQLPTEDNYPDIEKYKEVEERLKNIDPNLFPENLFSNED